MINRETLKLSLAGTACSYRGTYGTKIPSHTIINNQDFIDLFGHQYFSGIHEDTVIIAFQGSYDLKDWVADVMMAKQKIPYEGTREEVKVHNGFILQYLILRESVTKKLNELSKKVNPEYKKFIFTGHSLGGALATLAALDFEYHNPNENIECATYGCPRVGNKGFVESYNKRVPSTWRVEYESDIITMAPPKFWGFEHVGEQLFIESKRCKFNPLRLIPNMYEHLLFNYIEKIEKDYGFII